MASVFPLDSFDSFLFDCDGVLWRGNTLLPGADRVIKKLTELNKIIIFVTNNSSKSRSQYLSKFESLGILATKEQIMSSAFASAFYLHTLRFDRKVFTLGEPGIGLELDEFGINHIDACKIFGTTFMNHAELDQLLVDENIGAVIVGIDPYFTYTKLAYAHKCLQKSDCLFIATNTDNSFPGANCLLPGGGSIVAAVKTAANKEPLVMGKPEPLLLKIAMEKFNLDPERTCMIGDKLETDIAFGKNGGLKTVLVLTGVSSREDAAISNIAPDYILESIDDLC